MTRLSNLLIVATTMLLTSCATLISGTNQNINIKAVDVATNETLSDVVCSVNTTKGAGYNVDLDTTSFISVEKDQGTLQFNCTKVGYKQVSVVSTQSFDGATIANILFWPGFIVDASTGSMKKYPSNIMISMKKI
jgi:hypothetical protein